MAAKTAAFDSNSNPEAFLGGNNVNNSQLTERSMLTFSLYLI